MGLNYLEHASEMDERAGDDPVVFLKPNTSVIGPDEPIRLPADIGRVDHEGELAIVIGSLAKNVRREDFASVVLGYTIANDVTARDLQARDGQWTRSKGFDTFGPLGPVIETEIDPSDIRIETRVDGDLRQAGSTNEMVHDIPSLVEFVSSIWTLLPGDVILTGTPAGVGQIRDGEVVEVTISGIGTLKNPGDRAPLTRLVRPTARSPSGERAVPRSGPFRATRPGCGLAWRSRSSLRKVITRCHGGGERNG
ncbi:fumarylacetoacetate hydrolase family protein [Sphingomonas sp. LR61]|uniref:fumarylacetoacetate hydrolase family protein n=1 Tax=Sphingomonas sp. LR61 TaxID=3050234 RepID=UPI002FE02A60